MAPDARLLSVKLADHGGAVDVSQMIAGIDWVVKNQYSEGMSIKVLNLSYGTISKQDAQADPLSWAAEVAWKAGIAVVASTGNDGDTDDRAGQPGVQPLGDRGRRADTKGTSAYTDDAVPSFSERGISGGRGPDLIAPGVGIVSLGVPGSQPLRELTARRRSAAASCAATERRRPPPWSPVRRPGPAQARLARPGRRQGTR